MAILFITVQTVRRGLGFGADVARLRSQSGQTLRHQVLQHQLLAHGLHALADGGPWWGGHRLSTGGARGAGLYQVDDSTSTIHMSAVEDGGPHT